MDETREKIPSPRQLSIVLVFLRYLSIGLPIVLLFRLVHQGLWRISPYSGLFAYLMIEILRDLVLLRPNYDTHSYTVLWEWTLPALLLGQVLAGLATYHAIGRLYPKLGWFGVRLFAGCLFVSCLACLTFLPFEIRRMGTVEAVLRVWFLLQRWVASLLAGGLGLAIVFLSRYPAPMKRMPRNIKVQAACLAAYFAAYAVLYELENVQALGSLVWAELTQLGAVCCIYVAWIVGLSRQGQTSEPWPELDPAVRSMIDTRYDVAKKLLRYAVGAGGRK